MDTGSDKSVGASGGWLQVWPYLSEYWDVEIKSFLQGGGHSILSNTMGLGVDRVVCKSAVSPFMSLSAAPSFNIR